MTSRKVIGPIIVPYTPDCDYGNGEELLSYEKIEALKESFKNYNIIDYQHQFTDEKQPYFMTKIGDPIRLFQNDEAVKFEDVTGTTIEVPSKTLWLESNITDEQAIKEIDDLELVAYSITVSEKTDAELVMEVYNKLCSKQATKQEIPSNELQQINENISSKRTLIKDIEDPVMLTTSLVKFPCVNKARFCKHSLDTVQEYNNDNGDNMSEKSQDNANKTFIDSVQEAVKKYRNAGKQEQETLNAEDVKEMINSEIGAVKEELKEQLTSNNESLLQALKDELTTAPPITEEDESIIFIEEESDETPVKEEVETTKEEEKETTEEVEDKPAKEETKTKGRGGKSKKHDDIPLRQAEPSAQKSRKNAKIEGEEKKMSIKRDELNVIYDAIKGNLSVKGLNTEDISYKSVGLTQYNRNYMDLIDDPIMKRVYQNSFTYKDDALFTLDETNTARAILNTNLFATYVSKIIQAEPLLQDVQYQTGIHGKGHIYAIDDTITTEDGALPENFYFDKDVAIQEATLTDREIQTYPQRTKINISDRQRLANVYGDDLVNILLDRTVQRLRRGVAAARFYGDASAANSVDLQFRRQDGYLKSAGQQLTSSDVNLDKITDLFDSMFYALPEEAQIESECIFYVPTNVRRAYSSYFLDKAADRAIDFIGQKTPLYWGDAPIKVSPTLNDKPMRDALDDGNVSVLLIKPNNTHFVVGREAGIEPQRHAETSSDTYYATMDSANAYSINDYAVRLSLTEEEYAALVTPVADDSGNDSP